MVVLLMDVVLIFAGDAEAGLVLARDKMLTGFPAGVPQDTGEERCRSTQKRGYLQLLCHLHCTSLP